MTEQTYMISRSSVTGSVCQKFLRNYYLKRNAVLTALEGESSPLPHFHIVSR